MILLELYSPRQSRWARGNGGGEGRRERGRAGQRLGRSARAGERRTAAKMQQDWDKVVIGQKGPGGSRGGGPKKVSAEAALKAGNGQVVTEKKFAGGTNKVGTQGKNLARIDDETEDFEVPTVPLSLGKQIQKARQVKGLTQAQLAQQINEKPAVIGQYEAGKAVPEPAIMAKMERALGVKLKRK
ncbi:Endothelial differentiation-related factor 1-like [Porphyridium purpureum]|uniref:Endothelial differentiation-related factor 1-like n=1 Tax=Porphyridium purpureum TaxID=35688 RepID=A0A5J4Z4E8_PORPP|nr:Endothelial differentiation-related factor 1-like [Porphyridium purpureum]|eukprot:POR1243..scf295_1